MPMHHVSGLPNFEKTFNATSMRTAPVIVTCTAKNHVEVGIYLTHEIPMLWIIKANGTRKAIRK